jgi:hypothetical protein
MKTEAVYYGFVQVIYPRKEDYTDSIGITKLSTTSMMKNQLQEYLVFVKIVRIDFGYAVCC